MEIKLIAVGKIKEKYLHEGINEFKKRIKRYSKFEIINTKEYNTKDIPKNIIDEGKDILSKLKDNDFVITLEIDGENLDSISLSKMISKHYTYSEKKISFIIGGSNGLSDEVKVRSNYKLSFGKQTYPHQLMRLILLEQIYRTFTIINNIKYHK